MSELFVALVEGEWYKVESVDYDFMILMQLRSELVIRYEDKWILKIDQNKVSHLDIGLYEFEWFALGGVDSLPILGKKDL